MAETATTTITLEDQDGTRAVVVRLKPKYAHLRVESSKAGQPAYDVMVTPDFARCGCTGYVMRGKCRHATFALKVTSATR